jgi:ElaB/YqjD/DUF883 family membrane-anchored ribosome-binding protein
MATILERTLQEDPETGCTPGEHFEECRQNYYLKQQNQILQQQKTDASSAPANTTSNTELEELRAQIEQQKTEIESLKIEQATPQNLDNNPTPTSPYPLIGIGLIIGLVVGIILIKLLKRK